jgi:hypothetical protein
MAPGPHGGPGGPRGGFGGHHGGHHGGGWGGHHGGWGGHHGGWGYGPRPRRPINVVPPSYSGGGTDGNEEEKYVDENGNRLTENAYRRKKYGNVKGTLLTLRLSTSGAMKEEMFKAKCATADELLKGKRITSAEAIKRKMDAAKVFYGYLQKIGCINPEEYDAEMLAFAQSVGGTYTPQNNNTNRRTR